MLPSVIHPVCAFAAWLLATIWTAQAFAAARGVRSLVDLLDPEFNGVPAKDDLVVVIVPACNEEAAIEVSVQSLLSQNLKSLHVMAVDDRSTDTTGALLDDLAGIYPSRLTVRHVTNLPQGWLGKPHAMALAAREAIAAFQPDWLLFTDADVFFEKDCLERALVYANAEAVDHLVVAPTAVVKTWGEAMLMTFLQVIGLWGAKLWRVADPNSKAAVGIGAFGLIRTSAYEKLGGFERLRMQILEDLALARIVKDAGLRQRVVLARNSVKLHWASGVRGVLNTMTKNLFAIFQFRVLQMFAACVALSALCLGPFVGLFWAPTRVPSLIAVGAILSLYLTTVPRLGTLPRLSFLGFPVSAVLFLYAILKSALTTLRQGGVQWRGTFYSLQELRRHAIKLQ